ncbi:ATP-binding cassette domain-containing protein [Salana multivorans]
MDEVIRVDDLRVSIGRSEIVKGVSFSLERGQTLGLVGESGSGKSMMVLAATGLLDAPASRVSGSSKVSGSAGPIQLVGASGRTLRSVHGDRIGFVFQDPTTSLNPLLTLERQLTEPLETHRGLTRRAARTRALDLLTAVGIPQPENRLKAYPHQLSGGQRQRVMIAIALACDPLMLVADEPTTALDVTTQAQIIELVRDLQERTGTAVVWISHDLGVIGQVADEVLVLREGEAVEQAEVLELFHHPQHAYTRELLEARPVLDRSPSPESVPDAPVLLQVEGLDVRFPVSTPTGRSVVHAVDDVSFEVRRGQTLGIVGESGSGKSTIAGALTGLVRAEHGSAHLGGESVLGARGAQLRRSGGVWPWCSRIRSPRSTRGSRWPARSASRSRSTGSPSGTAGCGRGSSRCSTWSGFRGSSPTATRTSFSGGQRQRVSIARALALEPELMILDESTASLDVSIQARVLDLLREVLQRELGLTYLFIAHDLAVVQEMSHDVLVLQNGRVMEYRPSAELFADPRSEYTKRLLAAIPPARPRAAA